jgi:hypothetical protein
MFSSEREVLIDLKEGIIKLFVVRSRIIIYNNWSDKFFTNDKNILRTCL